MNHGKKVAYRVLCRQYLLLTELENNRECHHDRLSPTVRGVSSDYAGRSTRKRKEFWCFFK